MWLLDLILKYLIEMALRGRFFSTFTMPVWWTCGIKGFFFYGHLSCSIMCSNNTKLMILNSFRRSLAILQESINGMLPSSRRNLSLQMSFLIVKERFGLQESDFGSTSVKRISFNKAFNLSINLQIQSGTLC